MFFGKDKVDNRRLAGGKDASADERAGLGAFTKLPRHVAIIMDGNGRWAKRRGLPRIAGHREGVARVKEVVEEAGRLGLEVLTLYVFSTENWRRPADEVDFLMNLLETTLSREFDALHRAGVRIITSGRIGDLPGDLPGFFARVGRQTAENTGLTLNLAINYGGRAEIVDAVRAIAAEALEARIDQVDVDDGLITDHLYHPDLPDPELIIRPSGEMRLSNFLLWQAAYSELYFTDVLWPDFRVQEFHKALAAYAQRERRFGGLEGR